ncbi:MAG: tetratricopeptide repeat protein [Chloroflexota bacterium]
MAKISLRVYNREIEGMIESGQLDEAIAHCLHILKTFPMHVDTYRLLGKSFLEGRKYAEAADIFQRVLMAVPDDFVANVGMSIIRDDENKLDDAIWHMERAFEVQPSNPAIQGELRRLYGRRDGVEPPKIRLSRDALAFMYAQGELYNQAIAEIRNVLTEDPNRPDLQVLLARAYYRAGHKVDATEMTAALLNKYHYCLDALRILVDVLPGTARAEDTQVYRQRLRMLDPYSSLAKGSAFHADQVADNAINLDRFEFVPGAQQYSSQPEWAASLGIKLDREHSRDAEPEWLVQQEEGPAVVLESPSLEDTAAPVAQGERDAIPEWLREAGWQESTGADQEGPIESDISLEPEPIKGAEIPDWLKSMAPPGAVEETEIPPAQAKIADPSIEPLPSDDSAPDWLDTLQAKTVSQQADVLPQQDDSMPDWLKSLGDASEGSTTAPEVTATEDFPPISTDVGFPQDQAVAPAREDIGSEQPVKSMDVSSRTEVDGDAALAWLEGLAAKQGARPEELLTKPEDRPVEPPSWGDSLNADPVSVDSKPEIEVLPVAVDPIDALEESYLAPEDQSGLEFPVESPINQKETGEVKPLSIENDTLAWLESLATRQSAKPEELLKLQRLVDSASDKPHPDEPTAERSEPKNADDITITSWLKSLDDEDIPKEGPDLSVHTEDELIPSDDLPDWLKNLEAPPPTMDAQVVGDSRPGWDEGAQDLVEQVKSSEPQGFATADQPEVSSLETPAGIHTGDDYTKPPSVTPLSISSELPEMELGFDESASATETTPTSPEEWIPAVGAIEVSHETAILSEEELSSARSEEMAQAGTSLDAQLPTEHPVSPEPAGMPPAGLSTVPSEDKDAGVLIQGQQALHMGKLDFAMGEYTKLIKKGRLLDEVIHDLREATYRHPVDIIVWQTLGDAYMRANRLQDALDSFNKAEELLR